MKSVFLKYTIPFLAAALLFSACNKKLDQLPVDAVTPDQIKTATEVKAVLYGAYDLMINYELYGEDYLLIPDLLGNNNDVNFQGTYIPYNDIANRKINRFNDVAASVWSYGYQVINASNIVLDKLDVVDASEQASVGGEAKFLRALMYFNLTNMYAKPYADGNLATNPAVPLVLQPVLKVSDVPQSLQPRATMQAMYAQLEKDLQDAVSSLPEDNSTRANKYAAEAMLSRVYMAEAKYQQAAAMADSVIEGGTYALPASFAASFNNDANSTEDIFAIQQTAQRNAGTVNNGLYTFYSPITAFATINTDHLKLYDSNDERGQFFYTSNNALFTLKWSKPYKVIPVIRLAEMYLTRGEANLRGGIQVGSATPLDDITTVRDRAKADKLTTVTAGDFVQERFRELAFEGDKYPTEKRLKMDVGLLHYNDPQLILPIPDHEMQINTKLVQNDEY